LLSSLCQLNDVPF
jgi:uncharacterized UBP type Zn finger protein